MPIVKTLQDQYKEQQAVLAALKAALPGAADDDKSEIQNQIDIYTSALADEAYHADFDPSRDPTAVEVIIGKISGLSNPDVRWHAEIDYNPGDVCSHNGEVYTALGDVALGQQPDDVFDADADADASPPTGGWIPVDYTPPEED